MKKTPMILVLIDKKTFYNFVTGETGVFVCVSDIQQKQITCIRERMLAKWVSMAPPCGKLADILFISSQKQLYVLASVNR